MFLQSSDAAANRSSPLEFASAAAPTPDSESGLRPLLQGLWFRLRRAELVCVVVGWAAAACLRAADLDTIGVTLLRQTDSALAGNGIRVAQVEAPTSSSPPLAFEVNPSSVGQAADVFTYVSDAGTAADYPNSVGGESLHADGVGRNFFGAPGGVASQIGHVDNYEAGYFFNNLIAAPSPPVIAARVVNQSFIFVDLSNSDLAMVEQEYDNYVATNNTLFVSGAGNGGPVCAPATCFNGLGVGVYRASSSVGPTVDGRCKPDLTAPGGATSGSTPYVAGAAAVLLQAAERGDGGTNLAAAGDARTLKALLLNGAVKPANWTNGPGKPLDARFGAGILNVFNSWKQLGGGQHSYIESTANPGGAAHPPGINPNDEPVLAGWNFSSIPESITPVDFLDQVHHYYFHLPASAGSTYVVTATLVWNRQYGQSAINDLNLFLYDAANGRLAACSTSAVDNVEHIFLATLPAGRYDLQVLKSALNQVSASETYALAFAFLNLRLSIALTNDSAVVSWPLYPAGFNLWSATNPVPPAAWSAVNATVRVLNGQNSVAVPAGAGNQFFRLAPP